MIEIIDVEQGTPEWFEARSGIATASCFNQIMTPAKLGKSTSQKKYAISIVAGEVGFEGNEWTERGHELEADARFAYQFVNGVKVDQVGFVRGELAGCSPDGLVGDDGGVEFKCLKSENHLLYAFDWDGETIPTLFLNQVYGSLFVTGRKWWDLNLYHPRFETLEVRGSIDDERYPEWHKAFTKHLTAFNKTLEKAKQIAGVAP